MEEGDPTNIYCANESVVTNSSNVESMLNKKHNSIAFHYTRWNVAAGIISIAWISTKENLVDTFTKRLPKAVRDYLFGNWTYWMIVVLWIQIMSIYVIIWGDQVNNTAIGTRMIQGYGLVYICAKRVYVI